MAPLSTIRHRERKAPLHQHSDDGDNSIMVPLTADNHYTQRGTFDDKGSFSKLDLDLDLGYEDYTEDEDFELELELGYHSKKDENKDEDMPVVFNTSTPLWQRLPLGLTIALVLFTVALLTTLRIIFVYEHSSLHHSGLYAAAFCGTVAAAFGMAAFIVLQTLWYNQMDLERALDQQDRARVLLGSVYPEHLLDRMLLLDDDEAESQNDDEGVMQDDSQWLRKLKHESDHESDAVTPLPLPRQQQEPSFARSLARSISMQSFLPADEQQRQHKMNTTQQSKSVTDLYPDCTVLCATIKGFTAWSSTRAPDQTFELLEDIFGDFDALANQAGVFKVEAMGHCYIAATGLPESDPQHAVRMAQFASDILAAFQAATERLERTLGPDTADLKLRIALNSGPVTAGILKGERSRFQLFGDTVNNVVLMERLGEANRVHMTRETAHILEESGKKHWVEAREASKAGNTYWLTAAHGQNGRRESCTHRLTLPASTASPTSALSLSKYNPDHDTDFITNIPDTISTKDWTLKAIMTAKQQRLIEWTVDQLAVMLKKIVVHREAMERHEAKISPFKTTSSTVSSTDDFTEDTLALRYCPPDGCVLDEVQEMVELPRIKRSLLLGEAGQNIDSIELSEQVMEELTNFVSTVSTFYYSPAKNPFHNFNHCAHVLNSTVKMMNRIVSPTQAASEKAEKEPLDGDTTGKGRNGKRSGRGRRRVCRELSREEVADHTYGITESPLVQFSVVFAALIHDIDHPGVPNAQLVKEGTRLARVYKNRSISEQNSLDMAWDLLMDPSYQSLVRTIAGDQEELIRFRQLLVQTVMATDIADGELRIARNQRWDLAFARKEDGDTTKELDATNVKSSKDDDKNRKATIVLEHLLQASDISHTMQHFDVFRIWNERLFREMYLAYLAGRAEKDPGEYWYKGEIGFFTFYIIPLAKKLEDCGVFGVSSDEYLNYAQNNLQIWEAKGEEIVKELREKVKAEYGVKQEVATRAA